MARKADLLHLTGLVYEAAVDPGAWEAAITAIAEAMKAREMSLQLVDPGRPTPIAFVAPRTDPTALRTYIEHWAGNDVIRERAVLFPAGTPYSTETLMVRSEFERTAYYNEYWRGQDLDSTLLVNAVREDGAIGGIGFFRSRNVGPFERDDERLLQALAPHLCRAVALNLRLARVELQRIASVELLNRNADGALLVDAEARILFANVAAEAMLRENSGLRLDKGRLAAAVPAKTTMLRRLIAGGNEAVGNETVVLPCPEGGSLTALVLPLRAETIWLPQRPSAIVLIKDSRRGLPSREHLQRLFDLTPAQAGLAREILRGDGVQAAADRLGISRATARTHLLEVFHKTGTSRQAELVRVILQRSLGVLD
jgi:DNA-binding CsgD family transcriptional regulator